MTQATVTKTGERAPEEVEEQLEQELELAFAPLHKRCMGMAVGVTFALVVVAMTFVHMARSPEVDEPLMLLSQYFRGYSVTALGAVIGAMWAFWVGFVIGWFFAFCRNFTLAVVSVFLRARAEMAENRGFLDHI